MNDKILLVGPGPMGIEYAKALKDLNKEFIVIGRSELSSQKFQEVTGIAVSSLNLTECLKNNETPSKAIVAVTENMLGVITKELINAGIKSILVEKPGAKDFNELKSLAKFAISKKAKVYVGYNRRFYASVETAMNMIKEDGGVKSFHFEFTEWGHVIAPLVKAPGVKKEWLFHNSSHVIDLAFYICGEPKKLSAYKAGKIDWHSYGAAFTGAGITKKNIPFSYMANWAAPGRWSVEVLTSLRRFYFKPMEGLQIQKIGTVAIEPFEFNNELDKKYKPGIFKQTEAFLNDDKSKFVMIEKQVENAKYYEVIKLGKSISK